MTYRLAWMRDVLAAGGHRVEGRSGWKAAGHGDLAGLRGVMVHHTAGNAPGDLNLVANGGSGTAPGPLANLYLSPDGVWTCVAAGRAYHAGDGGPWKDVPADRGNDYTLGIEVSDLGTHPDGIRGHQYAVMVDGVRLLLDHAGMGVDRLLLHRTWTDRKIDIRNDLGTVREDVEAVGMATPEDVWRWDGINPNSDGKDDTIQAATALKWTYDNTVYALRKLDALIAALEESGTIGPLAVEVSGSLTIDNGDDVEGTRL